MRHRAYPTSQYDGGSSSLELIKNYEAIKLVDPQKEGPCDIDGSAVSYMKFKTTEGQLLLKQLKKMAKEDVSIGISDPDPRLAHWTKIHGLFRPQ
ncbi:hypothetical protein BGZ76_004022 [Entomortierella beljakovae]|nr:hypothetical protein BGZ76_004022 [Entomortierella beljakovae]